MLFHLILFKPDCVRRGLVGECLARFERRGFCPVTLRVVQPCHETEVLLRRHYEEYREQVFFEDLIRMMSAGPFVACVLQGSTQNSEAVRQIIGPWQDPRPGTIRGDYATSSRDNLVHGSDSSAAAKREIGIWFPEFSTRSPLLTSATHITITTIWPRPDPSYVLAEWYGRSDAGLYISVRCKRGIIELRAHPEHTPGMDDIKDCVELDGYDYRSGAVATYDQVREALIRRGHRLPAQADGTPSPFPERPLFSGYQGPGSYALDWNSGTYRRVPDGTITPQGFSWDRPNRTGAALPTADPTDHDPPAG